MGPLTVNMGCRGWEVGLFLLMLQESPPMWGHEKTEGRDLGKSGPDPAFGSSKLKVACFDCQVLTLAMKMKPVVIHSFTSDYISSPFE